MEWRDDAIVLSTRRHGESGTIVMLMTAGHGRHAGLVRGQKVRAGLQPGTRVRAVWRARLADQLGSYALEPVDGVAAALMDAPLGLAALVSACALVEAAVPERQDQPAVFAGLAALLDVLDGPVWDAAYVQWEIGLLGALGFGLDLTRCAVTGAEDDLVYVSPRTGRAVSRSGGAAYRDRLLPLPGFLVGEGEADPAAVLSGLELTGHFLQRNLFGQTWSAIPDARTRYVERYRKWATSSGSTADS